MSEEQLKLIEQLPGSYLDKCRAAARCPEDEALLIWLKGMVRLDDPMVTQLAEALRRMVLLYELEYDCQPAERPKWLKEAISAYEARMKEVSRE